MTDQRIRELAREEINTFNIRRNFLDLMDDSKHELKREIVCYCDLKIENTILKRMEVQRNDIYENIRSLSLHDPIIKRNIEDVAKEFSSKFEKYCDGSN